MEDPSSQTYEQASAQKLQSKATDPIHYNAKYSYRNSPYRNLYHQHGKIGTFQVRLVEAQNLKRHHWSVLGMGPVKLLGLSRAYGQVSSFAVMKLSFCTSQDSSNAAMDQSLSWENDSIASRSTNASVASANANNVKTQADKQREYYAGHSKEYKSTIVRSNSNPSWPTLQSSSNVSVFNIDLEKEAMSKDEMGIFLSIKMKEEWSTADSIVPVKGGGNGILGESKLNLTPLLLKGFGFDGTGSEVEANFMDEWINLSPPPSHPCSEEEVGKGNAGRVRVIITYEPNGLMPRRGDTIALEAFARQSVATCAFRPILNPLHPLKVKDVKGEYFLCSFDLPGQDTHENGGSTTQTEDKEARDGCLRLHRNCCFVIERTNIIDSARNAAMKPADVVMSTSIGQEVSHTLSPYVETAGKYFRMYGRMCLAY